MDQHKRQYLHDQDKRLIDSTLAPLVPPPHAAPNGHGGAREAGQAARDSAHETNAYVDQVAVRPDYHGALKQPVRGVGNHKAADHLLEAAVVNVQQEPHSKRQTNDSAGEKCHDLPPVDITPQHGNTVQLNGDAADYHDHDELDRVGNEVQQHRAAD